MTLLLATIADLVSVAAEPDGLWLRPYSPQDHLDRRDGWPKAALDAPGGLALAMEVEQGLEMGLADTLQSGVRFPYSHFAEIDDEGLDIVSRWTDWSPLLLKIARFSDLGRPDFRYQYEFMRGARPIVIERIGYFVHHPASDRTWRLDRQTWALVEAMDGFNTLPSEQKTRQRSWLTFAEVKDCSAATGAALDDALQKNDVIVPSRLGLQMHFDREGALSFAPRCEGVDDEQMRLAFFRNPTANGFYSVDVDTHRRLRVVLDDKLREVVCRMQRVRNLRGEQRRTAELDPSQFFDGVLESIDLSYGPRVTGIGPSTFPSGARPVSHNTELGALLPPGGGPRAPRTADLRAQAPDGTPITIPLPHDSARLQLLDHVRKAVALGHATADWEGVEIRVDDDLVKTLTSEPGSGKLGRHDGKYILIYTNEDQLEYGAGTTEQGTDPIPSYDPPHALAPTTRLHTHQEEGVRWLQACQQTTERRGVILADDMGLGKSLQILSFVAWCIESGRFPELSAAPFRPILVIAPLILLENRTWENEMSRFFRHDGAVFMPWLALHGSEVRKFRTDVGKEVVLGRPILDLDRIRQHRVVLTNYETVKNYQHSFACVHSGGPLWSLVISDEAQEYKTPGSQISHALKALAPQFHIACTGTPVENRLMDLWNLTDTVQPGLLGAAADFRRVYEGPITQGDQQALANLKQALQFGGPKAHILRRDKKSVVSLPPKTVHRLKCEMSAHEIAAHRSLTTGNELLQAHHLAILGDLVRLSQHPAMLTDDTGRLSSAQLTSMSSKLQRIIDELHRIRGLGEKAIIFSRHIKMQGILAQVLSEEFGLNVQVINGKTRRSSEKSSFDSSLGRRSREQILEEFRNKHGFNLLILSPFVAGVGLTIVEANHVFHYDRWWNPAVEAQATDRAYRIGQSKDVHVYLPILHDPSGVVPKSFDEALDALMERKQRLAEDFLRPMDSEESCAAELWNDLRSCDDGSLPPITLDDVDMFRPLDFEALVAELLSRTGTDSKVVLTAKGNDGGADVIVVEDGRMTVVQVKHSSKQNPLGIGALDDVLSAGNTYGNKLRLSPSQCIVTNTYPQGELLRECEQRGVHLIARDELAAWLSQRSLTRADVTARASERCRSFRDGVVKIEVALGMKLTSKGTVPGAL